jgi:hypothetical protein
VDGVQCPEGLGVGFIAREPAFVDDAHGRRPWRTVVEQIHGGGAGDRGDARSNGVRATF